MDQNVQIGLLNFVHLSTFGDQAFLASQHEWEELTSAVSSMIDFHMSFQYIHQLISFSIMFLYSFS
jgi:hypothetical protein